MGQNLADGIRSMLDEREEVYFLVLVVLLSVGWLGLERLTGTEYIAGVATLYGLLIAGGARKALTKTKEHTDG